MRRKHTIDEEIEEIEAEIKELRQGTTKDLIETMKNTACMIYEELFFPTNVAKSYQKQTKPIKNKWYLMWRLCPFVFCIGCGITLMIYLIFA